VVCWLATLRRRRGEKNRIGCGPLLAKKVQVDAKDFLRRVKEGLI
jgi:hypothetical protein